MRGEAGESQERTHAPVATGILMSCMRGAGRVAESHGQNEGFEAASECRTMSLPNMRPRCEFDAPIRCFLEGHQSKSGDVLATPTSAKIQVNGRSRHVCTAPDGPGVSRLRDSICIATKPPKSSRDSCITSSSRGWRQNDEPSLHWAETPRQATIGSSSPGDRKESFPWERFHASPREEASLVSPVAEGGPLRGASGGEAAKPPKPVREHFGGRHRQ